MGKVQITINISKEILRDKFPDGIYTLGIPIFYPRTGETGELITKINESTYILDAPGWYMRNDMYEARKEAALERNVILDIVEP